MNADILGFLKNHGEQLDAQIAKALDMPLDALRREMSRLVESRDIICCNLTRYVEGNKIEGVSCRISCHKPPATPGRKPGGMRRDLETDF